MHDIIKSVVAKGVVYECARCISRYTLARYQTLAKAKPRGHEFALHICRKCGSTSFLLKAGHVPMDPPP